MKDQQKFDALMTDVVDQDLSIDYILQRIMQEEQDLNGDQHEMLNDEQLQSEIDLAQQAQLLLQSSSPLQAPQALERHILRKIRRGHRRSHAHMQTQTSFSTLYSVAIIILLIFSIFQVHMSKTMQNRFQTPLRPLSTIKKPTP